MPNSIGNNDHRLNNHHMDYSAVLRPATEKTTNNFNSIIIQNRFWIRKFRIEFIVKIALVFRTCLAISNIFPLVY